MKKIFLFFIFTTVATAALIIFAPKMPNNERQISSEMGQKKVDHKGSTSFDNWIY